MKQRVLYTKLASYYDFLTPSTTEKECNFLDEVFKKYKEGKIIKVLDLGCGTGRHTCLLSKMGYKMTGIDLSEEMLKIAKNKCPEADFRQMDFTKVNFPKNSFDAAICMWSTIGYILSEKDFKNFVKGIYKAVNHLLVLDSSNYENPTEAKPVEQGEKTIKLPGVTIKTSFIRYFDKTTGIRKENYQTELEEKGKPMQILKDENKLRMWTKDELTALLKPEFKILEIFGDYSLKEKFIKTKSPRKIILSQKSLLTTL